MGDQITILFLLYVLSRLSHRVVSPSNRIRFPFITVEEEEPRLFTGEIFKAILDNDQATLEILIADGFPVNQRDLHRMTPLQR